MNISGTEMAPYGQRKIGVLTHFSTLILKFSIPLSLNKIGLITPLSYGYGTAIGSYTKCIICEDSVVVYMLILRLQAPAPHVGAGSNTRDTSSDPAPFFQLGKQWRMSHDLGLFHPQGSLRGITGSWLLISSALSVVTIWGLN